LVADAARFLGAAAFAALVADAARFLGAAAFSAFTVVPTFAFALPTARPAALAALATGAV